MADISEELVNVHSLSLNQADEVVKVYEDPFAAGLDEIHSLRGIGATVKKRIKRKSEGTKSVDIQQTAYDTFQLATPPYNIDYLCALYEISGYHRGAVDAKVTNTVGLGYSLIETDAALSAMEDAKGDSLKRARAKKARLKTDILSWLDDISEDDDLNIVLRDVWTDYLTTGNGYLEIGRTVSGSINYLGHIPSTTMRIRIPRDGYMQIVGGKAVFFKKFGTDYSDPLGADPHPNEVIHFKNYTPANNFYGVPEIVSARSAVAGNEFSARFNLDYFEHKAAPRYVIVTKNAKMGDGALKELMEFLEGNVKGKNHRTVVIPLSSDSIDKKIDFEMKPVEAGVQEGSFKDYRTDNRDEILMAQRTPINKLGLPSGINLAAARDADKMFKEQVCGPEQSIINKKITKIVGTRTDIYKFELVGLTLTDEKTQAEIDKVYATIQSTTPNEIRGRKGHAPLPDGDKVLELSGGVKSEQKAQVGQTRTRDAARTANSSDSSSSTSGRNAKGDGRKTP